MNEERQIVVEKGLKERIQDLQLEVLLNFFECAMYKIYGEKWKKEVIKAIQKTSPKYKRNYKSIIKAAWGDSIIFADVKEGVEPRSSFKFTDIDHTAVINLILHNFLSQFCECNNFPENALYEKVRALQNDRNDKSHYTLSVNYLDECSKGIDSLNAFMQILEECGWNGTLSSEFKEYLQRIIENTENEEMFLQNVKKKLLDYKVETDKKLQLVKGTYDKTVKIEFVDSEGLSIDDVLFEIISDSMNKSKIRGKADSILLSPDGYYIFCLSVPEEYENFESEHFEIKASDSDIIYKTIQIKKKVIHQSNTRHSRIQEEIYNFSPEISLSNTARSSLREEIYNALDEKNQAKANELLALARMYFYGHDVEVNRDKAYEYLAKSTEYGNAIAQNFLGNMYYEGEGVEKDNEAALAWYAKAAEQGNIDAIINLGDMYYHGETDVDNADAKAFEYYEKAAKEHDAYAKNQLAICYADGLGVEADVQKAVELYKEATEQGNIDAVINLGDLYYYGEDVEQDYAKAVEYYTKAAEQQSDYAQNQLAICYEQGLGVEVDAEKAKKLYEQAAEQGNADAMYNLGRMCFNEEYYVRAVEWFQKAEEAGNEEVLVFLGKMYHWRVGVKYNDDKEMEYYLKQSSLDAHDALSLYSIGVKYFDGKYKEQDYEKVIKCLEKVTDLFLPARYRLGGCYEKGLGVAVDLDKAVSFYEDAGNGGFIKAMLKLGDIYFAGEIVEQDIQQGIGWYKKAITNSSVGALYGFSELAQKYYNGEGVKKDFEQAFRYYSDAIRRWEMDMENLEENEYIGDLITDAIIEINNDRNYRVENKYYSYALDCLGDMYFYGQGTQQNYSKGIECYEKAAEKNNKHAIERLGDIYYYGNGIAPNYDKALKYYLKEDGVRDECILRDLGDGYFEGKEGVEQSYEKAAACYEKLIAWSYSHELENKVGNCYELGEKNLQKAFEYYKHAAEWGSERAMANLGRMYANGIGVAKDYEQALKWYEKAVEHGFEAAEKYFYKYWDILHNKKN